MIDKKRVYLDYAATTPVDNEVIEAMLPFMAEKFGNPMSVHSFGHEALEAVDEARSRIAGFLGCATAEIIFTSGSTESNNLAIKGAVQSFHDQRRKGVPEIIALAIEHHCIMDSCERIARGGGAKITYLPVGKEGIVSVDDIANAVTDETLLVSVMYVNNEVGTIQPVAEIGELLKKINADRKHKILFHTDATQAPLYFDCDVDKLGVDLLSVSGHKIYGPKGVGMLYVRRGTPIKRVQDGGDQEYNLRSGTHNVPGIVGLGKAIERIKNQEFIIKNRKILELRDYLIDRVLEEISGSHLNGSREKRSPNNANFRFDNVEGEGLVLSLDMEGIAASTGSACSSGALEPSHVLLALGLKHEEAHGSLRLTLGRGTTKEEIDFTVDKIKEVVNRLRSISGNILADFNKKDYKGQGKDK